MQLTWMTVKCLLPVCRTILRCVQQTYLSVGIPSSFVRLTAASARIQVVHRIWEEATEHQTTLDRRILHQLIKGDAL